MNNDMKCPFCQQELEIGGVDGILRGCPKCRNLGTEMLWQELIRTRKALEQSEICCTEWEKQALDYKAENIALSGDLERTHKALDIAVDALKLVYQGNGDPQDIMRYKDNRWTAVRRLCMQALDEITALKQKE